MSESVAKGEQIVTTSSGKAQSSLDQQTALDSQKEEVVAARIKLGQQLYAVGPAHLLSYLCEFGMGLFGIYFAIVGALLACTDFRKKTLKAKAMRFSRGQLFIAKQLALVALLLFSMLVAIVLAYCLGNLFYLLVPKSYFAVPGLNLTDYPTQGNLAIWLGGDLAVALFYCQVGYFFAFILKNPIIGIALPLLRMLFIPTLGAYDPNNIQAVFANSYFDPYGSISLSKAVAPISPVVATCVVILVFVALLATEWVVNLKRGLYS
ncbi:MAG: hypothetical protein LBL67_01945 [Coriobacteriales bacterium]|nr:hypothetical protein [Coriobacteriales bacterium]